MKKTAAYLLMLMVALLGGAWIHASRLPTQIETTSRPAPRANFPAPEFAATTLDGKTISSADLRGKIVLVNFWATWCPPCRAEMPIIETIYREHRDHGFVVLAIDVGEDQATAQAFAEEFNLTFPILLDPDTNIATKFQVSGMPTSFFMDKDGIIRAVYLGAMNRAYIEKQILPLLGH